MFFFKKRATEKLDLGWLNADMHSHLIPGIDDGSPDIDTSLKMIKGLAEFGYKKIITTPHILWEIYPNTPEIINAGLETVREAVAQAGMSVEVNAAAEYFLDDHFDQQLKDKAQFLTLSGNMVLVEFSMITAPMELQQLIFDLQMQNYQPVLAHPERYVYMNRRKEVFDELKASGCMFQLNLMSLTGHYGASVQDLAEYLIKKEYYDLAGTDMHNPKHLDVLQKLSSSSWLRKLKDSGLLKNHQL
jgi:tyrosine-protein phosphatase YwqE